MYFELDAFILLRLPDKFGQIQSSDSFLLSAYFSIWQKPHGKQKMASFFLPLTLKLCSIEHNFKVIYDKQKINRSITNCMHVDFSTDT